MIQRKRASAPTALGCPTRSTDGSDAFEQVRDEIEVCVPGLLERVRQQ